VGKYLGPKFLLSSRSRFLNPLHLKKTQAYFEKYGGKTIIIARFIPIVRTFAPFLSGVGAMNYKNFLFFNVSGAFLWVGSFLALGFWFGELPQVKHNFTFVILGIILVSVLPIVIEILKSRQQSNLSL
jgi:membrane-associated protein